MSDQNANRVKVAQGIGGQIAKRPQMAMFTIDTVIWRVMLVYWQHKKVIALIEEVNKVT